MISVPTVGTMLAVIGLTLLGVALLSAVVGALFTRQPRPAQLARPTTQPAHRAVPGQRAAAHDREDARI